MTLYLTEADVESLLGPEDALEAVEGCFRRMAAGAVDNRPRYRVPLEGGVLAVERIACDDGADPRPGKAAARQTGDTISPGCASLEIATPLNGAR